MKFYKIMFFNFLVMGSLISISSMSWFGMWMGLEINLLSIIPLFSAPKNMFSSESSIKYFIAQAIASMILLFSVILMLMFNEFFSPQINSFLIMIMDSALLMKLGAAPFHFWFPEVMKNLTWINCFILLTWQKITPMILIMNQKMNKSFFFSIIMFSLMISTLMSLNQTNLRLIMTFSSINHISWMLSSMLISQSIWLIYMMIYTFINLSLILTFHYTNSFYMNQINMNLNSNKILKFSLMVNFMSLGGLPPFIGFLPKWITINWMINMNMNFTVIFLILFTLIMLFVYLRLIFSTLLMNQNEIKFSMNKTVSFLFSMFNLLMIKMMLICTFMFNLI